jgi:CubicO group peptidase (beta-lactamase class C family)
MIATGLSALTLASTSRRAAAAADWPTTSPESQGIDKAALDRILETPRDLLRDVMRPLGALRGVAVVRNGFLIGERYYTPDGGNSTLFPVHSVTKSVASLLVGIALAQGRIKGLDQTIGELLPEAASRGAASALNAATLRQILTQTTGLPEDAGSSERLRAVNDLAAHVLELPLEAGNPPRWRYSNAGASLLSPILERAVGGSLEAFARTALFAPLGIANYTWQRGKQGSVTTASGLSLSARDVAKLAWITLEGGRWRKRQILPAQWAADSTATRVGPTWGVSPVTDMGYGYLWFTGVLRGRPVFWGWGYGAQFAVAVPSLKLVIATLAKAPEFGGGVGKQNSEIMSLVSDIVGLAS